VRKLEERLHLPRLRRCSRSFSVEKSGFPTVFNTKKFRPIRCGKLVCPAFQRGESTLQLGRDDEKRKENGSTFFWKKEKASAFLPRNHHGKCREILHV
jgi:hypothetical protein